MKPVIIIAIVFLLLIPIPIFAQTNPACVGCTVEDAKAAASEDLENSIHLSVWTDKANYGHNDIIKVEGQVANESGYPVTITVISPENSIVTIDSLSVVNNSFETTLNTAGAMWKYDGTYTIKVNYGTAEKSNSAKVELTGGVAYEPNYQTPTISGMFITATTEKAGNIITVTGKTVSNVSDVTFAVTSPSGNYLVAAWQDTPDDNGNFGTTFTINSGWKENGFYSIVVKQGTSSLYGLKVLVEVTDGITLRSTSVTESNSEMGIYTPSENNAARDAGLTLDAIIIKNSSTMFEVTGMTDRVSQDITLTVTAPNGDVVVIKQISPTLSGEFSNEIIVGGALWEQDGFYTVTVRQFNDPKYTASVEVDVRDGVVGGTSTPSPTYPTPTYPTPTRDTTPPKILKPTDITVNAKNQNGSVVPFEVLVIDDTDNIVNPACSPRSNSFFAIGETRVICNARDSSGNKAIPISFYVTVNAPGSVIPDWVKNIAAFWCDDKIDDGSFIEGIQYLIDNEIITVSTTSSSSDSTQDIPLWIKNNACWWSKELITDKEFTSGIEYLVKEGIIRV